jgi:2-iminobutanoate/2-iminopropanoate deaminase
MPTKLKPFEVENPNLPYSPVVRIGNHFHFSGVIPSLRSDNVPQCPYAKGQAREIMVNMEYLLKKCGLTFNDLFHVTIMLSGSMDAYKDVNEVYSEALKDVEIKPARKCFAVAGLPFGALVEIEFEALKQN